MCLRVPYISSSLALSGTPSGALTERQKRLLKTAAQWRTEGRAGVLGIQTPPPPEFLKALQNRAKLNSIVKTVKYC